MTRPSCSGGQPDHSHGHIASEVTGTDGQDVESGGIISKDTSYNESKSEMVTGREHLFRRAPHLAKGKNKEGEGGKSELVCTLQKPNRALLAAAGE